MRISKFRDIFQSLETQSHISDFSYLEIIQQIVEEIFADDVTGRLVRPEPNISTTAATTVYSFKTLFPSYLDTNSDSRVRKLRGLWKPALSPTDTTQNDYGRNRVPFFDQKNFAKRVYDGDVYIDNELRQVTFKTDPGTTTDIWKADFWLKAPTLAETDELPILPGWERRILLRGARAYFEELDEGSAGKQSAMFEVMLRKYRDAVNRDTRLDEKTADLGFDVGGKIVQAQ